MQLSRALLLCLLFMQCMMPPALAGFRAGGGGFRTSGAGSAPRVATGVPAGGTVTGVPVGRTVTGVPVLGAGSSSWQAGRWWCGWFQVQQAGLQVRFPDPAICCWGAGWWGLGQLDAQPKVSHLPPCCSMYHGLGLSSIVSIERLPWPARCVSTCLPLHVVAA